AALVTELFDDSHLFGTARHDDGPGLGSPEPYVCCTVEPAAARSIGHIDDVVSLPGDTAMAEIANRRSVGAMIAFDHAHTQPTSERLIGVGKSDNARTDYKEVGGGPRSRGVRGSGTGDSGHGFLSRSASSLMRTRGFRARQFRTA